MSEPHGLNLNLQKHHRKNWNLPKIQFHHTWRILRRGGALRKCNRLDPRMGQNCQALRGRPHEASPPCGIYLP